MTLKTPIWMITNAASGSHNAGTIEAVDTLFANAGTPIERTIVLGEDELPTGAMARAAGVGLFVLHGGDGTITSASAALQRWQGDFLVLPGGTMNLLSRALHGELSPEAIVIKAVGENLPALPVPVIVGEGHCALAGIIAGPTSAWGEVREQVRRIDLKGLASSIPEALAETLSGDDIAIDGMEGSYQAIYLQPATGGIMVRGVLARNAGDLLKHGWAWLSGDFRDGPSVELGTVAAVTLRGSGAVGLLVDGEKAQAGSTLHFVQGQSAHRYLSCRGEVHWS